MQGLFTIGKICLEIKNREPCISDSRLSVDVGRRTVQREEKETSQKQYNKLNFNCAVKDPPVAVVDALGRHVLRGLLIIFQHILFDRGAVVG